MFTAIPIHTQTKWARWSSPSCVCTVLTTIHLFLHWAPSWLHRSFVLWFILYLSPPLCSSLHWPIHQANNSSYSSLMTLMLSDPALLTMRPHHIHMVTGGQWPGISELKVRAVTLQWHMYSHTYVMEPSERHVHAHHSHILYARVYNSTVHSHTCRQTWLFIWYLFRIDWDTFFDCGCEYCCN